MKLISTEECIMSKLNLNIIDKVTRQNVAARVQILDSQGEFLSPENSILKIGPGLPFFYSDGIVECDVPRGPLQVLVERGTEYIPNVICFFCMKLLQNNVITHVDNQTQIIPEKVTDQLLKIITFLNKIKG